MKIELNNYDEKVKFATININNNKFDLILNEDDEVDEIINKDEVNKDLKKNFNIFFDNYDSIKYVNALNFILRSYGKSEISNIYKFLGLPISFESKMNLLISKDLYIKNLLNA